MYYSDTSVEEPKPKFATGDYEWKLCFEYTGFPVSIIGKSSAKIATVYLGDLEDNTYARFGVDIRGKGVNEIIEGAKSCLDYYFADYTRGVN